MHQIVSDTLIGGEGEIPLTIETKSLGTATTAGGTDTLSLMAQTQQNQQALQALSIAINNLSTNRQGNNFKKDSGNNTVTTKIQPTVKVNYYRQWTKYYY